METGLTDSTSVIIDRQIRYLSKLRQGPPDDYIMKIVTIVINVRSPICQSQSSRRRTCLQINPKLEVSPILRITGATDISEKMPNIQHKTSPRLSSPKGRDRLMVSHIARTPPVPVPNGGTNRRTCVGEVPHITDITRSNEH